MKHAAAQVRYPHKRVAARTPSSRTRLYLAVGVVAFLLAGGLVAASQLANHSGSSSVSSSSILGVADNAALFAGLPQHGNTLGAPTAPVTLVEYADLQCPYCGDFARVALPALVNDYVRTGKVRLVFRGLAFVGDDSLTALRAVVAASYQGRMWNLAHLIYANQGAENTGWVRNDYLRSAAGAVRGLNVGLLFASAHSSNVTDRIAEFARLATQDGVQSTPSFRVGKTGRMLEPLVPSSLDAGAFRPAFDALLRP